MKNLEGPFYEKISHYFSMVSRTELLTTAAVQTSFSAIQKLSERITRLYNYQCYTKVYPSLGQHIT